MHWSQSSSEWHNVPTSSRTILTESSCDGIRNRRKSRRPVHVRFGTAGSTIRSRPIVSNGARLTPDLRCIWTDDSGKTQQSELSSNTVNHPHSSPITQHNRCIKEGTIFEYVLVHSLDQHRGSSRTHSATRRRCVRGYAARRSGNGLRVVFDLVK
jgi:hypothetical protein